MMHPSSTIKYKDPVCGKELENPGEFQIQLGDHILYFCSLECMQTYFEDSEVETDVTTPSGEHFELVELTLPVRGMTCASCVQTIESALKSIPGVISCEVNFGTQSARLALEKGRTSTHKIVSKIEKYGYRVASDPVTLFPERPLSNEEWESIRKALLEEPGVIDARYIHEKNSIHLKVLPDSFDRDRLLQLFKRFDIQATYAYSKTREDPHLREYHEYRTRFAIALFLSIPVHILSHTSWLTSFYKGWLLLILTTPVQFWCGWPFIRGAIAGLRHKRSDMNTLIALGTLSAFAYSVGVLLIPEIWISAGMAARYYFDTSSAIITLILMGRTLEMRARYHTGDAIRRLIELQPSLATVWIDGKEETKPVEDLQPGDAIVLRPGDRVPVDGRVAEGEAHVDTSMLTGESRPQRVRKGDFLMSGSVILDSRVIVIAEVVGQDTILQRIIEHVRKAQASKAPIQRIADRVSGIFVPIVLGIAFLTLIIWGLIGPEPRWTNGFISMVSVLIIACPCALGLATPTAVIVGMGQAAKRGILIKSAEVLERVRDVDCVVFDKTGTLTEGKPKLIRIESQSSLSEGEIIRLAATAEAGSEHPLGRAIVEYALSKNIEVGIPETFRALPGEGIVATVDGHEIFVGRMASDEQHGEYNSDDDALTISYVVMDGKTVARLLFHDPLRHDASEVIKQLKERGLHLVLLSGDRENVVAQYARKLGIDRSIGGVLPVDKSNHIRELQEEGYTVMMIGDGINDAPALVQADVGIAVKRGTDIAFESASIVFMRDDLKLILYTLDCANKTVRTIYENLGLSFIYNILAIPIAAGLLYPFTGYRLSPILAALAMSLSSVSVVLNALYLRKRLREI